MLEGIYFMCVVACTICLYMVDAGKASPSVLASVFMLCVICGVIRAIKERRNSVCG